MTGLEIDREWAGEHAPRRMNAHGEDYDAAVQALRQHEIGGASWGQVGLIAKCASALGLSGHYLHEVLGELGPGLNRTGEQVHVAASNITTAEHASLGDLDHRIDGQAL
ncbi:hypothetical protein GCM10009850_120830 [Nonomuraea monospora]|uniref:Uncharacterized protein n=1 Tax=Nonomuraea monospora TaxID=568818 RepID=A0ABN3D4N5_9ACTN